jgi:hypothetical protein
MAAFLEARIAVNALPSLAIQQIKQLPPFDAMARALFCPLPSTIDNPQTAEVIPISINVALLACADNNAVFCVPILIVRRVPLL